MPSPRIVIIGNGIAGTTCARHVRKLHAAAQVTVISSETHNFFSRPALMYIYMGHMTYAHTQPYPTSFWKKNRIQLCYDHVEKLDFANKKLQLRTHAAMPYDMLVLATGSASIFLNWPGHDLKGVQGLYSYPDLLQMQEYTKDIQQAVVVGGGLIGIELAEMLHTAHIDTTLLVREAAFWRNVLPQEEAELIGRHIDKQKGVTLRLNTELTSLEGNTTGQLQAVRCSDQTRIACQFAGLAIGVRPQVALVKDTAIEVDRGILVDEYLRSSVPDVYAIGDCAQLRQPAPHRRAVEAVWYVGRMMGETLAHTLTGTLTPYRPGVWFNSAKFFDIEYQTYGQVPPDLPAEHDSLYWEDARKSIALRIVFDKASQAVLGCNALGIRQRHAVWETWIQQGSPLSEVLNGLEKARFDAEFAYKYESILRDSAKHAGLSLVS